MKTFSEWVRNESTKTLTITCRDQADTLEKLIKYIKAIGNMGHTFSIVVDPHEKGGKKFEWDGDGSDAIYEIESKKG
jgi:hypothetical protein